MRARTFFTSFAKRRKNQLVNSTWLYNQGSKIFMISHGQLIFQTSVSFFKLLNEVSRWLSDTFIDILFFKSNNRYDLIDVLFSRTI